MLIFVKKQENDINTLFELEKRTLTKSYDYTFPSPKELDEYLKDKSVLIVYNDSEFIGYLAYTHLNKTEAEIATIIIASEKQGQGYGKQIVDYCIEKLKSYERIKIVTDPKNLPALILYLKKGFIISDFKKNYYGEGKDRVVMYRTKN